jgi:hypothetical protein
LIETINKLMGGDETDVPPPPDPELIEAAETKGEATLEKLVSDDPFEDLVKQALGRAEPTSDREMQVRGAVLEVLEASLPTLVDTITERVLARLNGHG